MENILRCGIAVRDVTRSNEFLFAFVMRYCLLLLAISYYVPLYDCSDLSIAWNFKYCCFLGIVLCLLARHQRLSCRWKCQWIWIILALSSTTIWLLVQQLLQFQLFRTFEDLLDTGMSWNLLWVDERHVKCSKVWEWIELIACSCFVLFHNLLLDSRWVWPIEGAAAIWRFIELALLKSINVSRGAAVRHLFFLELTAFKKARAKFRCQITTTVLEQSAVLVEISYAKQIRLVADIAVDTWLVAYVACVLCHMGITLQHLRGFKVALWCNHVLLFESVLRVEQVDFDLKWSLRILSRIVNVVEFGGYALIHVAHFSRRAHQRVWVHMEIPTFLHVRYALL